MEEHERIEVLENDLTQMLKPVRGIPFYIIVKSLAEQKVIKFDKETPSDARLLEQLRAAIQSCAGELRANPIRRPRLNEVGNNVEAYVARAVRKQVSGQSNRHLVMGMENRQAIPTYLSMTPKIAPRTWNARYSTTERLPRQCDHSICHHRNHLSRH